MAYHKDDMGKKTTELLEQIAGALGRLAPPAPQDVAWQANCAAYIWQPPHTLVPVPKVNRVPIGALKGIDQVKELLLDNTLRFAKGFNANNALLWGARGMGKSSLVKAVHAEALQQLGDDALTLIEIHREDIPTLPALLGLVRCSGRQVLLLCDDLSFEQEDASYKSLKSVLEGGLEGRPDNVLFYATSNRRHLMPRDMMENERSTAINPSEAVEEKVSLSDRFGLWLGFHKCTQDAYLEMVQAYCEEHGLDQEWEQTRAEALTWATTRGARSGRVAWQFIQDLAGRLGKSIH